MSTESASREMPRAHREEETGRTAFRIYRVRVNGEVLGVVPERRLWDLLVTIKGINLYRSSRGLDDGRAFETDITVHGRALHVEVKVNIWRIVPGGRAADQAALPQSMRR